jgi:hypothetical protein
VAISDRYCGSGCPLARTGTFLVKSWIRTPEAAGPTQSMGVLAFSVVASVTAAVVMNSAVRPPSA